MECGPCGARKKATSAPKPTSSTARKFVVSKPSQYGTPKVKMSFGRRSS